MVFLDVYDAILDYLEEKDLLIEVRDFVNEVLEHQLKNISNANMKVDIFLEYALFNYESDFNCETQNVLLIDYLQKILYPDLEEFEKKQFDLLKSSERHSLKFIKKEETNDFDTFDKPFFHFYYQDLYFDEEKIIRSSSNYENFAEISM